MNKQNKGITLVALVITIIVLIILAAVSINAVMNDGLIKNAKDAAGKWEAAKENEIAALSELESELLEAKGNVAQWSLPTGDTEVNVGDLLTPTVTGLENEKFYVIADDGTTLTLLAERNVNTSEDVNEQASGINPVAFDNDSNVYNGSDIQGLVNAYVGRLTGLDLEDVEVAYGANPVTGVKGRLMWFEEAQNATSPFKDAENYSDILYGPSTARICYWLGSPGESIYAVSAWYVVGDIEYLGDSFVGYVDNVGLRPVIKILKSNI